ncbi:MAG: DNA polymerase III subunit alpha [Candidatus Sumerlaeota bacterium]|nr:DNA polymerase III subunit alpha [Candidatus Sumerlaeota bacterium]
MSSPQFIHLHNHSEYSLLDGACRCKAMCERAKELGMPALAITDHGAMFGAVEFYKAAREAGVKPIIGCEFYIAPGPRTVREGGERASSNHLLVLAKDIEGYHNLIKLCSEAYASGFYYKPRIDMDLLARHCKGLVIASACLKGTIAAALLQGDMKMARRFADDMIALIGRENFFIELMDHGMADQRKVNPLLIPLAREFNLRTIATNDIHYLKQEDWEMHDIMLCIGTGKKLSDQNRMRYPQHEFYFKTPEQMTALFRQVPEALSNTLRVAEMCNVELPLAHGAADTSKFPKFTVPEGQTAQELLRELAEKGLAARYGAPLGEVQRKQAELELDVIHQSGFDDYFLIVQDFIQYAREQGIPVGPGRGSGAASIIAYALGITDLEPLSHKLIFERFLNIERLEPPDFDIDFCAIRRQEVVEYVRAKYGEHNVCNIVTFGSLKAKNAIRDVGRVLDFPLDRVNPICGMISTNPKATIDGCMYGQTDKDGKVEIEANEDLRRLYESDLDVRKLIGFARQVEGLHRNCGVHAAGIIITDRPVSDLIPVFHPGGDKSQLVSQFAMAEVTESGLLKMDFLGLKNLTVIDNAIRMLARNRGVTVDWDRISRSDPKTYEFLRTAQTTGIFQLESEGMRKIIREMGPTCFADVAAVAALYRPGPMEFIPVFVKNKKNPAMVTYPHPMLSEILSETYGVIVYQEQVMQIAQTMGGFTMGQADKLRKAMGKKKVDVMNSMKGKFLEGAAERGVDATTANEVWELMAKFAEYGFNKAHTVAYTEVAFRTAYLKAHYPIEFIAALMTNDKGDTDKLAVLFAEARDMGIKVLPPDINESQADFSVVGGAIRFGLTAIKNVGEAAVGEIVQERDGGGPFKNFLIFCERTAARGFNSRMLECLIKVGAFDSLGYSRARLVAGAPDVFEAAQVAINERKAGQMSLFGEAAAQANGGASLEESPLPDVREWTNEEKLNFEKELTGFFISGHPLDAIAVDMRSFATAHAADFDRLTTGSEVRLVGQIGEVRRILTKTKSEPMAFCQITDTTGAVDAVVFPRKLSDLEPWLINGDLVVVKGKVNEYNGAKSLIDEDIVKAQIARERLAKFLDVTLPVASISPEVIGHIKQALSRYSGRCKVRIVVQNGSGAVKIQADSRFSVEPSDEVLKALEALPFSKTLQFAES